jgi:hypothetical protein
MSFLKVGVKLLLFESGCLLRNAWGTRDSVPSVLGRRVQTPLLGVPRHVIGAERADAAV